MLSLGPDGRASCGVGTLSMLVIQAEGKFLCRSVDRDLVGFPACRKKAVCQFFWWLVLRVKQLPGVFLLDL